MITYQNQKFGLLYCDWEKTPVYLFKNVLLAHAHYLTLSAEPVSYATFMRRIKSDRVVVVLREEGPASRFHLVPYLTE